MLGLRGYASGAVPMSPSTRQAGHDTDEWESEADRICATWDDTALLRLKPMGEGLARQYLGMASKYDRSQRVREHFADQVRGAKD